MAKYGNQKTVIDGIVFDSKREGQRYQELRLMERAGEISGLERQVTFPLLPRMKAPNGKVVQGVKYIADFVYRDRHGALVVEDAKGYKTKEYVLKKKLLLDRYGYWIQEV